MRESKTRRRGGCEGFVGDPSSVCMIYGYLLVIETQPSHKLPQRLSAARLLLRVEAKEDAPQRSVLVHCPEVTPSDPDDDTASAGGGPEPPPTAAVVIALASAAASPDTCVATVDACMEPAVATDATLDICAS